MRNASTISENSDGMSREFEKIETSRLSIVPINKIYLKDIFNEKNNNEVNMYLSNKSADTIDELSQWIEFIMKKNSKKEVIQLQFSSKENMEFIGLCVIKKPNSTHPEIGLWLSKSSRGQGYGKELVEGVVSWIKGNLEYEYIIYETFEENIGSVKIIESLGGEKHAVVPKENYFGETMNHVQYRIYNSKH